LFALNQYYVNKGDYENALKVMDQYLLSRPKDADAYLIKAQTFMQKGDLTMGLSNVQEAIKIAPMDSRGYMLGAQIYQAQKDQMNLSLFSQAVGFFQAKDQTQYSQGAEAIKGIYMSLTGEVLVNENLPE
jgi:tetratricopeptide (TPR) repeat protein